MDLKSSLAKSLCSAAMTVSIATTAHAATLRAFVSGVGNDSNTASNCSHAAPCRTLAVALTVVTPGGEIEALDPAGYGPITVSGPLTLVGVPGAAISAPSGGHGITINAGAGAVVNLRGWSVVGNPSTLDGIFFNATTGTLNIQNCVVSGVGGDGIGLLPGGTATFNITDTLVSNVANNAVVIQTSGSGAVTATFTRVQAVGSSSGFLVNGANSTGTVNATIDNSTASKNTFGVTVESGAAGAVTQVMVSNTVISNNGTGVFEDGANSTTFLAKNTIAGNVTAFNVISSGSLFSFNDNYIKSNNSDGGAISLVTAK
jgi:hypothetical protein